MRAKKLELRITGTEVAGREIQGQDRTVRSCSTVKTPPGARCAGRRRARDLPRLKHRIEARRVRNLQSEGLALGGPAAGC